MLPLSTHLFSHWSIPLNKGNNGKGKTTEEGRGKIESKGRRRGDGGRIGRKMISWQCLA
jgi:hypothetical protein